MKGKSNNRKPALAEHDRGTVFERIEAQEIRAKTADATPEWRNAVELGPAEVARLVEEVRKAGLLK